MIIILVFILIVVFAAANGANDVSKGVATLVGSGVTRYRAAILWGAITTLAGALVSGFFAERMLKLFTTGIVSARPTSAFIFAVTVGAVGWVAIATMTRLPVSTTHAIIGSMLGAGLMYAPRSLQWANVAPKFATPLLFSIAASYGLSAVFNRLLPKVGAKSVDCICVGAEELDAGTLQLTQINVITGTSEACASARGYLGLSSETLHWLSSGAVGFARGLNDTPKLVAIGVVVLGSQLSLNLLLFVVAGAMFAGSLYAGRRVAHVLAEKIVRMDDREGLMANLATALLVGVGANLGLPMSTTHVSSGAIAGIAGKNAGRLERRTIRDLTFAWTATPIISGLIAAISYLLVAQLAS